MDTLEEFHQSCLVTRKVYYIDSNSLSAMFFFLTARQFGYTWTQQPYLFPQEHSATIAASFLINWYFLSLDL